MKTGYAIKDIEEFARNPKTYEKLQHSSKLGIFISAAINKNIREGERVFINSPIPIDLLFYNLKGSEAHTDKAGDRLGYCAENSRIYAGNAGAWAGYYLKNSELRVVSALDYLGYGAKNSTVYAEKMKVQYNKESHDQVKNLRLCIGTLEGKLKHKLNFLKGLAEEGNEICLSKQTYNKHRILYKMAGAKIWEI